MSAKRRAYPTSHSRHPTGRYHFQSRALFICRKSSYRLSPGAKPYLRREHLHHFSVSATSVISWVPVVSCCMWFSSLPLLFYSATVAGFSLTRVHVSSSYQQASCSSIRVDGFSQQCSPATHLYIFSWRPAFIAGLSGHLDFLCCKGDRKTTKEQS